MEAIAYEGSVLINGNMILIKEVQKSPLAPFSRKGIAKEKILPGRKGSSSSDSECFSALVLDLTVDRTMGNTFMLL